MNFEDRVLQHEFKLNDTDDAIIEYIRENRDQLNTISIQKVAMEVFTVPNAVMRLCRKLGYDGFSQLKVLLHAERYGIIKTNTLFNQNITKTLELINYDTFKEVASRINSAKKIHFIGVGESLYYCQQMADYLHCFDYKVAVYDTYREIEYRIEHCNDKDMFFVISASGQNEKINQWIKDVKKKNVYIVSITHFYENPLAMLADIPLYFWGPDKKINGYNVTDRTGMMMMLRELTELFWQMYCV